MSAYHHGARRWRALALVSVICVTALLPVAVVAQDAPLGVGASATVTGGSPVLLRTEPGWDAASVTQLPAGAGVSVLNGPLAAADGSLWYEVTVWADGQTGWVPAYGLVAEGGFAATETKDASGISTSANGGQEWESNNGGSGNTVNGQPVGEPPVTVTDSLPAPAIGTGTIAGTNGEGVRCRADASYDAWVITVLAEGTTVELTGAVIGEWQPVNCAGQTGYVYAGFVSTGAPSVGDPAPSVPSTGDTSTGAVTGYATVSGTNGDGVRCRADASYDASIITVVGEGEQVALRGGAWGEWQPVVCAGTDGFVYAGFLGGGAAVPAAPDVSLETPTATVPDTGDTGTSDVSGYATVTGTNGDGVRCRSDASYDAAVIAVLVEGEQVALRGGAWGEWQPIVCAGTNGFVYAGFLATSGSGAAPAVPDVTSGKDPAAAPAPGFGIGAGNMALVTSDINLRYDPSANSGVAAVAPAGTVVTVTGEAVGGYYPVDWDGLSGYMYADYLTWTDQAPSERGGSAVPGEVPVTTGGGGSASGSAMVDFAMQYVGYPYVWAGEGPYGFDCSGFTLFVARNVLGMNITHDMHQQFAMGTPVGRGELQPGDLVFFQNTFQWGLSHVGIYIGGGQFVHAENESTGVKVSDLNSDYYSSRWYGASRLA